MKEEPKKYILPIPKKQKLELAEHYLEHPEKLEELKRKDETLYNIIRNYINYYQKQKARKEVRKKVMIKEET